MDLLLTETGQKALPIAVQGMGTRSLSALLIFRAYVRSVLAAGGVPVILSPMLGPSYAARALDGADGLLLTGGEDIHPAWYGADPSPHLYPPSRERDLF